MRAAAFAAASAGSRASSVSRSSSSIVIAPPDRPPSPFAASAAKLLLRSPEFLKLFPFAEFSRRATSPIALISSSSPSPYRPKPRASLHKSAPRGGIAISRLHVRRSSTLRITPAFAISPPGRFSRTALSTLTPGAREWYARSCSASVKFVPRSSTISALYTKDEPEVTVTTLSTPSVTSPPAFPSCGSRSSSGTNAGKRRSFRESPLEPEPESASSPKRLPGDPNRRAIQTALDRTTPSAHRTSSLLNDPEPAPCLPGFLAHIDRNAPPQPTSVIHSCAALTRASHSRRASSAYVPRSSLNTLIDGSTCDRVRT
mmetsp:Transcript_7194/g.28296  ORF Transcript_7194/g.28296 Transcript_7194/m.28296 type:complete len:315 (-) Transcript_7194:1047-1991(-)